MRWLLIHYAILAIAAACFGQPLSIRQAVDKALSSHPLLEVELQRISAAEGLRLQASLRPNPLFIFQVEGLRAHGNPGFRFGHDADTFGYLQQPIETGGKRGRRVDLAKQNLRLAELEKELVTRQIANRVRLAYWTASGAQRIRDLLIENSNNFEKIVEYHRIRVREGAMAEVDLIRVQIEAERLELSANTAALEAERARIRLFESMGQSSFPPVQLSEPLDSANKAPAYELMEAVMRRAEVRIAQQDVEQARANERLQSATATPDVQALLGYKRSAGFNTLITGVHVDLPFWSRNQGNIAEARAKVRAAEFALASTKAQVQAEIVAAQADYDIRRRQVSQYLEPLRERARESSRIALAAYQEGGADLLRLLDAERVRIDAEMLYFQTLAEFQQSAVSLEDALGVMP